MSSSNSSVMPGASFSPNYSQDIPTSLTLPPFDVLSERQRVQLAGRMNIHYFPKGTTIIEQGERPTGLFLLMKGVVEERQALSEQDEVNVFTHYHQDDLLDVSSVDRAGHLVAAKHEFKAVEDSLAYEIPNGLWLEYVEQVPQMLAYLHGDIDQKLDLSKPEHHQNLAEFILTRIDEQVCEPILRVNPNAHLGFVLEHLLDEPSGCVLVEGIGSAIGQVKEQVESTNEFQVIITKTDMLREIDRLSKLDDPLPDIMTLPLSCSELIKQKPLVSVALGEYLFNAMLLMTKHGVERVLVTDDNAIIGVLYQTQLLSLFSTHSHVLSLRIARANTLSQLKEASEKLDAMVATLFSNGIKVQFLMSLVSTLNEMIIAKAFQIIMPKEVQQNTALMVMGSEGRGEQILKTDQDNALIIRDGFHYEGLSEKLDAFSYTLEELGYPKCKGRVMVNNPHWVAYQQVWLHRIRALTLVPNNDRLMELAILQDARYIAGDPHLFDEFKSDLSGGVAFSDSVLAEYAATALKFETPLTFWGNLKSDHDQIDIKQGGLFPIVHGVRAFALKHGVKALSTMDRIDELERRRLLEASLARKLKHGFCLLIRFRLQQQLDHLQDENTDCTNSNNQLKPSELNRAERDLLRQSLHTVKKFKQRLIHHFHLEMR
ncbi:putative nucleotidyltransferase substrate binding domain-containing protein [Litoribrevibacter euphylliae]|uniref:Nucleotidyltransferase substrate binding domain-containing protein n=1 Tax=Litoribrevibacter euphylliae TaxID=1834034 RepID=A0ABV7HDA2_9GAMM